MINVSHKQKYIFKDNGVCILKCNQILLFYFLNGDKMKQTPFHQMSVESYKELLNDLYQKKNVEVEIYNELMKFLC